MKATALKPIISGFQLTDAEHSDTGQLLLAQEKLVTADNIDAISPWRFTAPLSPHRAAAMGDAEIDRSALLGWCRNAMRRAKSTNTSLLIEGVGGVMVPLSAHFYVADWIEALALPTVLVTGSYLGTLSHTLSAVEVLHKRGLRISAVVISETPEHPHALAISDTLEDLRITLPQMGAGDCPIFTLSYSEKGWAATTLPPALLRIIAE